MELYHFTSADRIDEIAVKGLEPRNEGDADDPTDLFGTHLLYWPRDCVWLTRNAYEIPTVWGTFDKLRSLVAVRVPTADKHLISFVRWMREKVPERAESMACTLDEKGAGTDWRSWWLYFGVILPSRIRGFVNVQLIDESGREL